MRAVRLSTTALRDFEEATTFIAADNPEAATRVAARLREAAQTLSEFPALGPRLPGSTTRRVFTVADTPFRLIYRVARNHVTILRLWHGARGWPPVT